MILTVPALEGKPWPSLGAQVCHWIEQSLVYGPGDLLGDPIKLDAEKRLLIWRAYELYPRGHPMEGRRRFERVAISLAKGQAKTELAAWVAAAELHHEAPVRCDGWTKHDGVWMPMGAPVRDPYIPMLAYDEEQAELLAYGALKAILEESPIAPDFDIGLERILRRRGAGRAEALSSSPNARDGARTTFQHFDETHLMLLPKIKRAHTTMLANITKRQAADGWSLETTTAPEPGANSVAEETMAYARAIAEKRVQGRNFFFFHRQASEGHDLDAEAGARAALEESYGPNASWANIEAKINLWHDPQYSREDWMRYFCNMLVRRSARAFDPAQWAALARPDYAIPDGALVTLGFDGAMFQDATGLVACEVETGHLGVVDVWERPYGPVGDGWQVPEQEVDDAVAAAFQRWKVWRMYADPPYWQAWVAKWAGQHGVERVVEWWTNRRTPMTRALEAFSTAILTGALSHDGHEALARHIGNAHKHELTQRDDQGRPLWLIRKERSDSPNKIDLAMAAVLSWEARNDAMAAGAPSQSEAWTFGAV